MTPARKLEQEQEPKGNDKPAKIMDFHVLINPDAPERQHRYVVDYEANHPLERAYQKGQLSSGRRDHSADDRLYAGQRYREIYRALHSGSTASSNMDRVSGGSGFERVSEAIQANRDLLKKIHERMSKDNGQIILSVCGEGRWPSAAVAERFENHKRAVSQTFCTALDNLIDAVLSLKLYSLGRK